MLAIKAWNQEIKEQVKCCNFIQYNINPKNKNRNDYVDDSQMCHVIYFGKIV